MKRKINIAVGKSMTDKMVSTASSHGGNTGVNAKRKRRIRVTVEESLNVSDPDMGHNERTTVEYSVNILVPDLRHNVRTTGVSYA
ncbi:unnamed protein product [Ilex paraguariensis]|uniref:Uncharacterized protein n=1 Tax=Ilex paraguariensis TaxID=185542 RepID=A0ABC8UL56_9AQUA